MTITEYKYNCLKTFYRNIFSLCYLAEHNSLISEITTRETVYFHFLQQRNETWKWGLLEQFVNGMSINVWRTVGVPVLGGALTAEWSKDNSPILFSYKCLCFLHRWTLAHLFSWQWFMWICAIIGNLLVFLFKSTTKRCS